MYKKSMQKDGCDCKDDYMLENHTKYDECAYGFGGTTVFPVNPMFGQSYVPWQTMNQIFEPRVGMENGTIYPELVSTYYPGQSEEEIKYLAGRNQMGEVCNR